MKTKRNLALVLSVVTLLAFGFSCASSPPVESGSNLAAKDPIPRIAVKEARGKSNAGEALLVCSYASEERCKTMLVKGALTRQQFEAKLASLPKDTEIIFFCA